MIKEKSQTWSNISQGLGKLFSHFPFKPNLYSWSTIPLALFGLLAFASHNTALGIIMFLLAGLLDLIDGAVARATNQSSHRGAFLDGSLDRFIDFFLIFSYFWVNIQTPWLEPAKWIAAAIFFAIMPSFEVAYANHRFAVKDPNETILWRIMNRGEMYALMLIIPLVAYFNTAWAGYLLVALVALSAITTLQTLFQALHIAKKNETHTQ